MFIEIRKSGVSKETKSRIEAALPDPKKYAGWKFKGYKWMNPQGLNTKHNGYTDNTVRRGGTPNNESLEELLRRGLDTTKLTISICPKDNVINGFTRVQKLIQLGYSEWIVALYDRNEATHTEFQSEFIDYLDDMRLGANEGDGSTPATVEDFLEIGKKRFANRRDKSSLAVERWVHSIPHSFSKKQVEGIANNIFKHYKRQGVVQKLNRDDAVKMVDNLAPESELVNTKSTTYATRLFNKIAKAKIDNAPPVDFVTFHSDAITHKEIDDGNRILIKHLDELHSQYLAYAEAYYKNSTKWWNNLGSLPQKIGVDDPTKLA